MSLILFEKYELRLGIKKKTRYAPPKNAQMTTLYTNLSL